MSSTPTNSWRGYRGSWQGGCNWNKRGNSYNSYKSNDNSGRDSPSVAGNQTPTHTDMDFLTPQSSPFLGSIPSTSELQVLRHRELELCPFEFWEVYLPSVSYESASDTEKLVTTFLRFFSEFYTTNQLDGIMCDRVIRLDYNDLVYDPDLVAEILNVSELIRDEPEKVLGAIGLAVHQILINRYANDSKERRPPISVQLYNYSPMTSLQSLRSSQYGKCVSVRGVVVRTTNVRARVVRMAFLCSLCKGVQVLPLLDGKYITPTKCIARGCRGRNFFPMKTSPLTESAGWQSISLQELGGGDDVIQRSMECEFNGCLVESCVPGDVVVVTAVVKAYSGGDQARTSKDRRSDLMYLRATSVMKSNTFSLFSEEDLMSITELQKTPNLFKLVTNSLSPSTYGHEVVKAGLILGLFGGVTKQQDGDVLVRGESHILLVGDPGQGKSQLLQAVSILAPRSVFVCGNSITASGLTVTLNKEAGGGGDYTLEAGTLVLGDNGVCCIDEFERMNNQQLSLIEAMDQQYIRVTKSGIVCNLPARTSVVAAANPHGGHYNKTRTISENLKMNTSLLSRFDLIFVLFDRPDEEMDHQLSERVMASHLGKKRKFMSNLKLPNPNSCDNISENDATRMSLSDKLKYHNGEEYKPIPSPLLKKYITYARSKVYPKLSPEAANILRRFYTELRSFMSNCTSIPITTRHLETLVRLTEARARVELRELATEEDASDVIGIIRYNLVDVYSDEMGCVKTSRCVQGAGLSQRNQVKALIAELTRISEIRDSLVFSVDEMREVSDSIGIPALRFEDIIYSLNNQCYLVKKGPLLYQLQTQGSL